MPLKDFKDLSIHGDAERCKQFIDRVSAATSGDWRRGTELEREGDALFAFVCEASSARPAAAVVLTYRDAQEIYVCNIVPRDSGELGYDAYNSILDEFVNRFARPVAEKCGLEVTISSGELRLEEFLSRDAFAALKAFSDTANRSTGSAHPSDARLWHRFVVLAHTQASQLSSDDLGRWLSVEGWDEDQVISLQIQYEQAKSLLRFYDGNR